jgi:hypothetical protein
MQQQKDTPQTETHTIHDEWTAIPVGILVHPGLTDLEKQVFWQVMRYDGPERHCTATNRTIAANIGDNVHYMSVSKAVSRLIDIKLLEQISAEPRVLRRASDYLQQIRPISEAYHSRTFMKGVSETTYPPSAISLTPPKPNDLTNSKSTEEKRLKKKREEVPTELVADAIDAAIDDLPPRIQAVFMHWRKKGLHLPSIDTKAWTYNVNMVNELLTGAAFSRIPELKEYKRQYTIQEIKRSIDRFERALTDPALMPVDKSVMKRQQLYKFILNRYVRTVKEAHLIARSSFLYYLNNEPTPTIRSMIVDQDEHPELTKQLIWEYNATVLGGIHPKMTVPNHNKFILAAKKLHAFVNEFRNKFSDQYPLTLKNMASCLVESIVTDMRGVTEKISPGYLCSEETFTRRFPAYLYQMAIIKEDVEGQPWKYATNIFSTPFQHTSN